MKGTSWIRHQDTHDALLNRLLLERGLDDVPFFARRLPEREKHIRRWIELAPERDGPVAERPKKGPEPPDKSSALPESGAAPPATAPTDSDSRPDPGPAGPAETDPTQQTEAVKTRARALGADLVGIARLRPEFVKLDAELDHDFVIALAVREDYAKVLEGPDAVDIEAFRVYARCAEIATGLAAHIRTALGHPALAHHNGGTDIQAVPAMYDAGFGELGRHGSLINAELGAHFRPAFVTTTLPLAADTPADIGVQDYCLKCRLCENVCPGDAIAPAENFVLTEGVRRWLVDTEKCYPISRLRPEYCHLCVDVCPYIHKLNGEEASRATYKSFVQRRKAEGFNTAKSGAAPVEPPAADPSTDGGRPRNIR